MEALLVRFKLVPILLAAGLWTGVALAAADAPAGGRKVFAGAIKDIPANEPATRPHRVRELLSAQERGRPLNLVISLRLRATEEFLARAGAGQKISFAEMQRKYLPLPANRNAVVSWLRQQGLTVAAFDAGTVNLSVRGSIAQVAAAFQVSFARVATKDGEFSSAVTAPSLPAALAPLVLNIDGLQPHIRMHPPKGRQAAALTNAGGTFAPGAIAATYGVPATLTGAGQTIIIIMDAEPAATDLTKFWTNSGISDAFTTVGSVAVGTGPALPYDSDSLTEVSLDTEWSSGMAPGAKVVVYAIADLSSANLTAALQKILTAAQSDHTITVVSYSAAGREADEPTNFLTSNSQVLARLAAAGITFLCSSGDGGSNPYPDSSSNNGYLATNALAVEYPASDPNGTAVGGTTMGFNANWVATSETAWTPVAGFSFGTGGGVSTFFSRPTWQTGFGVPAGTRRCVPDVAAVSESNSPSQSNLGGYVVLNGSSTSVGGTSLSSPMWAGMVALINQARASRGLGSVGLLGPWVYPLIGTGAFQDITSGNNGTYSAGAGYDLCTGVGTPNLANLIALMETTAAGAPQFVTQPVGLAVGSGTNGGFSVAALGAATITYQWQVSVNAGVSWSNLTNAGVYTGTATGGLTLTHVPYSLNGAEYRCAATNSVATADSAAAVLTVAPAAPSFVAPPQSDAVNLGDTAMFSVTATGDAVLTYQWLFNGAALNDGAGISGSATSTLTIVGVQASNLGTYSVRVSDAGTTGTSAAATLSQLAAGDAASHAVVGTGYVAGQTATVTNTLTYSGAATSLTWQVLLPAGWSFAGQSGATGQASPTVGQTGEIEWTWTAPPASPVTFGYTLNVPAGATGAQQLSAIVEIQTAGSAMQTLAQPDPLTVAAVVFHSADENQDKEIELNELTRVIELYNTRNGTRRTGAYVVQAGTEDGYAPDATRVAGAVVPLSQYHSADENQDGFIGLNELTRVIELYNYHAATTRTGQYHPESGTEDNFAPGP